MSLLLVADWLKSTCDRLFQRGKLGLIEMRTRSSQEGTAALPRRRAGSNELTTDGLGERGLRRSHLTLHARRRRRDALEHVVAK